MEFKNFTLECYKVPESEKIIGMFNIRWATSDNTRFDWAIFDNENKSQEGIIFNTLFSSNLIFSAELDTLKKYFVLLTEMDGMGTIISRTWEFIDGSTILKSNCTLSKLPSEQLVPTFTKIDNVESFPSNYFDSTADWPDWDFPTHNTPTGWIEPTQDYTFTFGINNISPLPSITKEQQPITNHEQCDIVSIDGTLDIDTNSSKNCQQTLDDLLKELEMLPIGEEIVTLSRTTQLTEIMENSELEDWEIELNKIIAELEQPFIKYRDYKNRLDAAVVNDYLAEKDQPQPLYIEPIPIPPPLPSPIQTRRSAPTESFKEELSIIRNRVMGMKNESSLKKSHKSRWFSLFR